MPHTLTGSTHAAIVSAERNGLLLLTDVLEVLDSALKLHAVDGLSGLMGVLERDTTITFRQPLILMLLLQYRQSVVLLIISESFSWLFLKMFFMD